MPTCSRQARQAECRPALIIGFRVAAKSGHAQFVWRHYAETEKFRRHSRDLKEPLVARERSFGSKP